MVIQKRGSAVRTLLHHAAITRATVSFRQVFQLFDNDATPHDVYDTLEAACVQLAEWSTAIYSALLAKSGSQLPGDELYDIFHLHRDVEYQRIAARLHVRALSYEQRRETAAFERARAAGGRPIPFWQGQDSGSRLGRSTH